MVAFEKKTVGLKGISGNKMIIGAFHVSSSYSSSFPFQSSEFGSSSISNGLAQVM